MKSRLFFALTLSILLLLCACNTNKNQLSTAESNSSESLSSESTPEESSLPESFSSNSEEPEPDEMFLICEIPDFPDADRTRLPISDDTWCVNIGDTRLSDVKQFFVPDETAMQLASAISLIDGEKVRRLNLLNYFDDISNANSEYMLFSALNASPSVIIGGSYNDANWTAAVPNRENIISQLVKYFYEEQHVLIESAYYADDVEKTLHYLFGESAEFNTEKVPEGYRYIPEENVFVATENNFLISYGLPQIISYTEKDGKYYVEAVECALDYDPTGELFGDTTPDDLLTRQHINYTFEKAKDGHFVLCGISAEE